MKANLTFEPVFTEWLLANLPMSRDEAKNSGAQVAGCSPATTDRYLKKLTSAVGPLREFKDAMHVVTVDFKPEVRQPPLSNTESGKQCGRTAALDNKPEAELKNEMAV